MWFCRNVLASLEKRNCLVQQVQSKPLAGRMAIPEDWYSFPVEDE